MQKCNKNKLSNKAIFFLHKTNKIKKIENNKKQKKMKPIIC